MKYSKMTREKCNMLNVGNFKFKKKSKAKKNAKSIYRTGKCKD